jgi:hypothetical protein
VALASGAAQAAEPPCTADVRTLCKDAPAGGGRIQACLEKQKARLSEPCRKRVDDLAREMGALAATCRNDVVRWCSDVAPGGGRVVGCLRANAADLSPECGDALERAK